MTERLLFHFSLSCTGEGNGNPLQCSCLENPRDGGAWWAAVYSAIYSALHRVGHDRGDLAAAAAGQGKYRYLELSLLGNHLSPSHLCLLVPASSPSRALGLLSSGFSSSFHRQAFSSSSSLPFSLLLFCVLIFVSFFFSCFISFLPCFYPC